MSTYQARKNAAKGAFTNFKLLTTSALTAAGLLVSGHAAAQIAPDALPQGAEVTKGDATYEYSENRLDITQNSRGVTAADYHGGFNIGRDASVYVDQRTGDIYVHRDKSDNTSVIEGLFEGDATNFVLNKNGVLITGSARINMHGFATSTADSVDFDGDKATFSGLGSGEIIIEEGASITVAEGGLAAFVAPTVKNAGIINAKLGKVAFAAGETVTLDLYGDGLFEVEVEGELADAYLENTGEINAAGGTVQMTALAAKDVADNIINLDGIVDVSSATVQGGKIVLSGGNAGKVSVKGKAKASGATKGGDINITGETVEVAASAEITNDGNESNTYIYGTDKAITRGKIKAHGDNAFVEFSGETVDIDESVFDVLGVDAKVLIDPVNFTVTAFNVGTIVTGLAGADWDIMAEDTITVNAAIDTSAQGNSNTLTFVDQNADDNLTINLNAAINLGANQTLDGEGTVVNVSTLSSVQDGVDVSARGADVNLAAGVFNEGNINIHEEIQLNGAAGGTTIRAVDANAIVKVRASNSQINDITFDSNGVGEFGIDASGPGPHNLTVDGNTFLGFSRAGVWVEANGGGTGRIQNNIFDGSNNRGVTTGTLDGGYTLNITDNTIGSNGDEIFKGIEVGHVRDAVVNINGGTIDSRNDGISLNEGVHIPGEVNIGGGIQITSINDEAIDVQREVRAGSTLNIGNGTYTGQKNSIEIAGVSGELNIDDATITGNGQDYVGVDFTTTIEGGDISITGGSITGVKAGIRLAHANGASIEIDGVTIDATGATGRGIVTGTLDQGTTLDITDNTIGANGNEIYKGIELARVIDAVVDIDGGSINSENDGISLNQGIYTGGTVNISDIAITSIRDEAVDVQKDIQTGAELNVEGGTYIGQKNGIELAGIAGEATLEDAKVTGNGADKRGVNLLGSITGALSIINSTITGGDDGIGSNDSQNNTVDGGIVTISDSTIMGTNSDGIELGSITNGGAVYIVANNINAGEDGVRINGDVTSSSRLEVAGNFIGYGVAGPVGGEGIEIDGEVTDSTVILSHYHDATRGVNGQNIRADGSGIVFGDDVTNSNVEIATYVNGADEDGLRFEGDIDNSTVKTGVATFTRLTGGTGALGGFRALSGEDGVEFEGEITGASTVTIDSNLGIRGNDGDGIRFEKAINDGSTVNITGNTNDAGGFGIIGSKNGILVVQDVRDAGTNLNINRNTIRAGNNGIDIDNVSNGATVTVGGTGTFDGNRISATNGNGIEFDAGIDSAVTIAKNRVSAGKDGINVRDGDAGHVTGVDSGAVVNILSNNIGSIGSDTIGDDGIDFDDSITGGSTVTISGNRIGRSGSKVGDDGIDIDSITGGATVNITNNPDIRAADNGIEISGVVNGGSTVNITGNNHGIHADDHGIYFGDEITGNATVNIHDNIITANEDRDNTGSGIWFDDEITNADVNIGDGAYSGFWSGASNIISVRDNAGSGGVSGLDGIHFDDEIGSGANIDIDGNRIGYYAGSVGGRLYTYASGWNRRIADDGIEFKGPITGNADISITDNYIRAKDDGIQFSDVIKNRANILIGGLYDQNNIDAWDNGISFLDDVKGQALIEISHNDIEGDTNGILFAGTTSNAKTSGGISPHEIYIHSNDIEGGNGINFEGKAKDNRHDIKIEGNDIEGKSGHGIVHSGGIEQAHLKILDNDEIKGRLDGVHIEGKFKNGARIDIKGNDDVRGVFGDGIEVTDTGNANGANVDIIDNHVHWTGDNGIEVSSVNGVEISKNTVHNTGGNGISVSASDNATIGGETEEDGNTITSTARNGILVDGGAGTDIRYNTISKALRDGIHVHDFESAWIAYNDIKWTGDDGIHVHDGDFVSIYNNYVDLSGFLPKPFGFGNVKVGEDANGIYVDNVGGGDLPELSISEGFGFGLYGSSVEIYGNDVANAEDDGVQVKDSDSTYIANNIIGHVGDDGVDIDRVGSSLVIHNIVTLAEDKGITIDGGDGDGFYAGVFRNRVLLTGDDGIQVENIRYNDDDDFTILGDNEYGYGWAVNVSGNEVAMTGDDGIEVRNSDATKVARNDIFMAGMGDDLEDVIEEVNEFANLTFNPRRRSRAPRYDYFDWSWGNGHGINVHGIDGAYYSPNGWAADIRGNDVQYTGGHGILAQNNDRTRISNNTVRFAGIEETGFYGASSFIDLIDNGPFESEGRRDLWTSEGKMIDVLDTYIGREEEPGDRDDYVTVSYVDFDTYDGIHAENIYGRSLDGLSGRSYLYDLKIRGNDVRRIGDDGIEVVYAGRTLIANNTVRHAGFGDNYDYGSGDYYGADGIHARYVTGDLFGFPGYAGLTQNEDGSYNYEPARNYALIVRNNDVRNTADDGIEVVGRGFDGGKFGTAGIGVRGQERSYYYGSTDRVLISENTVRRSGIGYGYEYQGGDDWDGPNTGPDGYGHDGIHVRGISGDSYGDIPLLALAGEGASGDIIGGGYYGYAVDIIDNDVRRTGDDGIEVINSDSTLILGNTVRRSGVGGGYYYGGADYYGADGIHVRNVGGNQGPIWLPGSPGVSGNGFEPYAVVIAQNDVRRTQDDGIEVVGEGSIFNDKFDTQLVMYPGSRFGGTGRTLIEDNVVRRAGFGGSEYDYYYGDGYGADGIHVRGVQSFYDYYPYSNDVAFAESPGIIGPIGLGYDVQIIGNDVTNVLDDGVEVLARPFTETNILVDSNTIENAGDNGIRIAGNFGKGFPIFDNEFETSVSLIGPGEEYDPYFPGVINSDILDNTVTNSGNNGLHIDGYGHGEVVLEGNTFIDNPTGARFESGEIDLTGRTNTFIVNSDFEAPEGFDFVTGMQFELAGEISPTILTIKDETLGTTTFDGYGSRSVGNAFYVRFEDGAILDENGNVIVIDGTFANWDGLVPNSQGNILSFAQLSAIEDRLFDADDPALNGRGQIFVGTVPDLNFEDFLQERGFGQFGTSGLDITVTGLPALSGNGLNNIQPAAGEGEEGEDLASIEPAAGGEDAACWGDAIDAASTGAPVNYSFGGTFEESLNDASTCSSTFQ